MFLCSPTIINGSTRVQWMAGQSEPSCGERTKLWRANKVVANTELLVHTLTAWHMVHTRMGEYVTPGWEASLETRYLCSHGTLESPIKLTPSMQRPTSCLHSWQINQIWLLLNIICTHLRTTLYIR